MTEGALERKRLDHVVLPRRLPGLALLERYFPSPADNVLDAELASFAAAGDTILDPWAGTGWTARRGVSHGMRVVAAEASPFAQMAAQAFLLAPEVAAVDAAFAQLSSSRRVDIPLRQHIEELYASRCPACNRPVLVEEFIWPRDGDAPGRKVYRCTACVISLGGPDERGQNLLGIERVTCRVGLVAFQIEPEGRPFRAGARYADHQPRLVLEDDAQALMLAP